jgi:hypothetical protein
MSDLDDVLLEISGLEKALDKNLLTLNQTLISLALEVAALKENQERILEILHLVSTPSKENREKVTAIMDAYDRYEFVRKLSTNGE